MLFILLFCFGFDLCTECNFHLMLCVSEKVWVDICAHAHVLIKSFCLLHELLNLFYFLLRLSNFDCSRILYLTYFFFFYFYFLRISCTSGYPSLKVTFRRWLNVHISIMRMLSLAAYRYIWDTFYILKRGVFMSYLYIS